MLWPTICVDDFFNDPLSVKNFADSLDFKNCRELTAEQEDYILEQGLERYRDERDREQERKRGQEW
jgi:hypothetical protein